MKECPFCAESIEDVKTCPHCGSSLIMECPFCAEEIKANAIKCKHCNSMIDGNNQTVTHTHNNEVVNNRIANLKITSGIIWFICGVILAVVTLFSKVGLVGVFILGFLGVFYFMRGANNWNVSLKFRQGKTEFDTDLDKIALILLIVLCCVSVNILGGIALIIEFYTRKVIMAEYTNKYKEEV